MYEVKNRYAILFSAAELLDKTGAAILNGNLYLRTIKKIGGWGEAFTWLTLQVG